MITFEYKIPEILFSYHRDYPFIDVTNREGYKKGKLTMSYYERD